ncbi:MAG: hypothetical protein GX992_02080 [Clostridium sp.]|nr:hypothetical protein [Clostridium sp.]
MDGRLLKSVITILIAVILLFIAVKLISWAVFKLLPIAIIIIAVYIVYRVITGRKPF